MLFRIRNERIIYVNHIARNLSFSNFDFCFKNLFCSNSDALFTTLLVRCVVQLELVDAVSSIIFGQESMKKVNFLIGV